MNDPFSYHLKATVIDRNIRINYDVINRIVLFYTNREFQFKT